MTEYRIPFNRVSLLGHESAYVEQALGHGHLADDGPFSVRCQALLEEILGVEKALLTTSGTHALEMAALLLDIAPGDEVIVPSFTFVSTINAFVIRGAAPVFVDIRSDTLNIDEAQIERHLTAQTKAIVVVHYGGIGCEMEVIADCAARHGIPVVEDNAHGLFGRYRDRYLGTFGQLAALSFHETKNYTCGEGGALIIRDPALIERAEVIREKGTNRSRFHRGEVDKYTWVDVGSSYLPSDLLAGVLLAQLESRARVEERRRQIWEGYATALSDWAEANDVRLPTVPPHCDQPHHLFYLLLPSTRSRDALIETLRQRGILAVFHYLPLHLSEMGQRFGGRPGDCPVTEDVSGRLVRLPFFTGLTDSEQADVVDAVRSFSTAPKP